jgi:uroporphyrinogen decarboxylase
MGHEAALIALLEDPDWMKEMFDYQMDLLIEGYSEMAKAGATVDGFFLGSDLAFKTGTMFSPQVHRRLCVPGLKRLCDFLHERDVDLIFHCDGDMRELLPNLVEAGVDCVQPLEVQAGLDVRQLKPLYGGRLAFMGNIGVGEMRLPEAQMEAIMADKINTAKQGGGYLYHSDHSIPPDIPFERYTQVLQLARKYGRY